MKKISSIFIPLLTVIIFSACGDSPVKNEAGSMEVTYEDFIEANKFQVSQPGIFIFRDDSSWNVFGERYWTGGDDPRPGFPLPEVDFEHEIVIGLFWGVRTFGCYAWVNCVDAIIIRNNIIEVHLRPLPELGECAMIVWPLQVIKMERYDLPVEFYFHTPGS